MLHDQPVADGPTLRIRFTRAGCLPLHISHCYIECSHADWQATTKCVACSNGSALLWEIVEGVQGEGRRIKVQLWGQTHGATGDDNRVQIGQMALELSELANEEAWHFLESKAPGQQPRVALCLVSENEPLNSSLHPPTPPQPLRHMPKPPLPPYGERPQPLPVGWEQCKSRSS